MSSDFVFDTVIIGNVIQLADVGHQRNTVIFPECLEELIPQGSDEINSYVLDLDILPLFPDMQQYILNIVLNIFAVFSDGAGVIKKSSVK